VSPRAPSFPASPAEEESAIPLLPVTPVDPGAWAAEHARPSNDLGRPSTDRRVQFAPDTRVAVFDVEDDEEGGKFEKFTREETVWIVISVLAVGGIGAAAVLATLYDWVL
jgi:hypothetical protein